MLFGLLAWWYGPGWLQALGSAKVWTLAIGRAFSVGILLRTLLSPWRRIMTPPGRSLDDKLRAMLDNLISRFVGFFVRLAALTAALFMLVGALIGGVVTAIIWPVVPVAIVYCIVRGLVG